VVTGAGWDTARTVIEEERLVTGLTTALQGDHHEASFRQPESSRPGGKGVAAIYRGRHLAEIDGDFVVFLIGARFSLFHPFRVFRDLGGRRGGMKAMLDYLVEHPEKGLLGYKMGLPVIVQYWRSFDHLEAFARDDSDPHTATWREYYRRASHHQGAGIWHETYLVRAGEYEAIYVNMPASGLGAAGRVVPAAKSSTARLRVRARENS